MFEKYTDIKDVYIDGKKIYYVSDGKLEYDELMQEFSKEYEFVRVPSLADKKKLSDYLFTSGMYSELKGKLNSQLGENVEFAVSFKDVEGGFDRTGLDVAAADDTVENISDRDAVICNGKLDWDKLVCSSLADLISLRKDSDERIVYISNSGQSEQTYSELYKKAASMAAGMQKLGIQKGDKAVFQFSDNRAYIEAFWACMILGVTVVPVGTLEDYSSRNVNTDKLAKICDIFGRVYIFCDNGAADDIDGFIKAYDVNAQIFTSDDLAGDGSEYFEKDNFGFDEPCLYLFTSGSTGTPKGVGLSQHNIFARTLGEIQMYDLDRSVSDFNWMTLTHAAGIIWSHIRDVYLNAFQVQAETSYILKEPLRLLENMSKYHSTTSWAPNFAYALLADTIDENEDYGWDLSNAGNVYTGGETNVSRSMRSFLKKTEKYGFPAFGLIPSFGMTETSSSMTYYNDFSYATTSNSDASVPVGTPVRGITVRICDADNNILKEGEIGYLQIKGENVITSYYQNPEADQRSFSPDGYLITGDLGYIKNNNVTLTGREKDVVIINGLNYYIQDIEEVAEEIDGIANGGSAIISVQEDGREKTILFIAPEDESIFDDISELKSFIKMVRKEIQVKCFITLDHVIPIKNSEFSYTEIGKKQRNPLKTDYAAGKFSTIINTVEELSYEYVMTKELAEMPLSAVRKLDKPVGVLGGGKFRVFDNSSFETASSEKGYDTVIDYSFVSGSKYFVTDSTARDDYKNAFSSIMAILSRYIEVKNDLKVVFPVLTSESFGIEENIITAVLKTLALENPHFAFKVVFMDSISEEDIEKEAVSCDVYDYVRYIGGKRYIEAYASRSCKCSRETASNLIDGKLSIVIGGAGGIGGVLCDHLTDTYRSADIAIIGRRPADQVKNTIARYKDGRVRYYSADVRNEEELRRAFAEAKRDSGREIGCIFNLAVRNIPNNELLPLKRMVSSGDFELFVSGADVKLSGIRNIEKLRAENSAVVYSFSSITSEFGWVNMAAYAASNLIFENYIRFMAQPQQRYISFGAWNYIGLNTKKTEDDLISFFNDFNEERLGCLKAFTPETGIRAVDNILCSDSGNCYFGIDRSVKSVHKLLTDRFDTMIDITVKDADSKKKAAAVIDADFRDIKPYIRYSVSRKHTSAVSSAASDTEKKVRFIWEDVLGISISDIDDNLFDIGGNSLSVFSISEYINEEFAVSIKPVDVMTYSTIRTLSAYLGSLAEPNETSNPSVRTESRRRTLRNR